MSPGIFSFHYYYGSCIATSSTEDNAAQISGCSFLPDAISSTIARAASAVGRAIALRSTSSTIT